MTAGYQPEMIQIEICTDCNLRCPFCALYTTHQGRPRHQMRFEEFSTLFGRNFSAPHLTIFSGFGETLLNSDLWRMVAFEKSHRNQVFVATNGFLLDAPVIDQILRLQVDQVIVTLDTLDAHHYARLRGNHELPRLLANLQALQSGIVQAGAATAVMLNYVVMRSTRDGLEPFLQFMHEQGLPRLSLIKIMKGDDQSNAFLDREFLSWPDYDAIDFARLAERAQALGIALQRSDSTILGRQGCTMPQNSLYISADWDVSCCPFLAQYPVGLFGNLRTQTIAQIHASDAFAQVRARLAKRDPLPPCQDCACLFSSSAQTPEPSR